MFPDLYRILNFMYSKTYKVNVDEFKPNIIGIRTADNNSNTFNDWVVLFYKNGSDWIYTNMKATTDPGLYWRHNPIFSKGTAILKPGQYIDCYSIGKHRGKYKALVQVKNVSVYRDKDQDAELDVTDVYIDTGLFGINIHRASTFSMSTQVDRWSAGCQVIADSVQYDYFMSVCKRSVNIHGNLFTYTLLKDNELW